MNGHPDRWRQPGMDKIRRSLQTATDADDPVASPARCCENQFLIPPKDYQFSARNEGKSNGALTRINAKTF